MTASTTFPPIRVIEEKTAASRLGAGPRVEESLICGALGEMPHPGRVQGSPPPALLLAGVRETLQSVRAIGRKSVTGYHPQVEAGDGPIGERTSLSLPGSQLGGWEKLTTGRGTETVDKCIHV